MTNPYTLVSFSVSTISIYFVRHFVIFYLFFINILRLWTIEIEFWIDFDTLMLYSAMSMLPSFKVFFFFFIITLQTRTAFSC